MPWLGAAGMLGGTGRHAQIAEKAMPAGPFAVPG